MRVTLYPQIVVQVKVILISEETFLLAQLIKMSTDQKNAELDKAWDKFVNIAKAHQQENYELSAEWTKYFEHEYKYLKQNIGYAIFGPPTENVENAVGMSKEVDAINNNDITTAISYKSIAQESINIVYNKILEFGKNCIEESCIYYGLIYNVTFCTKSQLTEIIQSDSAKKNEEIQLFPMPIFKIRRPRKAKDGEIWYIDICGRIYKNWTNYLETNTLPKCTMVFPKDGLYQPDPSCETTEEHSTVWLEVLESPACCTASIVLGGADTASTVVGALGLGLGIASMFTPLAPVAVGAAVASTVSGVWTIGRSTHTLIDKSSHEESLLDRNAFPAWLAIGGSTIGIAASGGSALLTTFTKSGGTVGTVAKVTYNSLVIGNVGINGVGITYQLYSMYEKYRDQGEIQPLDVVFLGAHILFFGNAVINLQFAGEIIETTQGKVLDDYKATIRSKHLRRQFNRAKRNAAANNADKISENAEVIRYINKKLDLRAKNLNNTQNLETNKTNISTPLYKNDTLKINGISLINPMKFVRILLEFDKSHFHGNNSERTTSYGTENGDATDMFFKLKDLLLTLLTKLFSDNDNRNVHTEVTKFYGTLDDMKYIENALKILPIILKIANAVADKSLRSEYLHNALHFTWNYIKESLKQICSDAFCISDKKVQNELNKIILGLTNYVDDVVKELLPAFTKYILMHLDMMASRISSSNTQNVEINTMQTSSTLDENRMLNIDGVCLIKPMKFVEILLEFDQNPFHKNNSERGTSYSTKDKDAEDKFVELEEFLLDLLREQCSDNVDESIFIPEITKFDNILNDMRYIKNASAILFITFSTSITLVKESSYLGYMYEAIHFMWNYVKESLKQTGLNTFCTSDEKTSYELNKMMSVLTDNKDEIIRELLPAFQEYILRSLNIRFSYTLPD
ncbi:uncharacterized protein LOC143422654 [Xylocopa sonorina]|uniref:uncharacterized protein LOC143422654 n=1 Tax=Xylocopa sonorina TaxID=1818115 RepID=UPI00403B064E